MASCASDERADIGGTELSTSVARRPPPPEDETIPLLAVTENDQDVLEANLVLSPIALDGCLYVVAVGDPEVRFAGLWPHGTEVSVSAKEVRLSDGRALAFGESFTATGGVVEQAGAVPLADPERSDYGAAIACATEKVAVISIVRS
ncbi:MAG: hypothetical protein HKN44_01465 [Ilumatobacter sp.]|nr:hypothetical protein [Ilumatobacter sp.]